MASLGVGVVRVVGGDRRDAEVLGRAAAGRRGPGSRWTSPWSISSRKKLSRPKMSWKSPAACAGLVVVADPQPGLHLARRAAGGADQALGVLGEQLAVGARLVEEALERGARREPEQVVHARGGLGEQRHVGVGAAAGDVVVAAVVPADPLALEAGGVRGEVGLHADDRLDPVRPWPWSRSRRRRTRCRGRSSRSRPCRARRCARTCRRAGRPRRAWSTRCARAGARTRRGTIHSPTGSPPGTPRTGSGGTARPSVLGEGRQPT